MGKRIIECAHPAENWIRKLPERVDVKEPACPLTFAMVTDSRKIPATEFFVPFSRPVPDRQIGGMTTLRGVRLVRFRGLAPLLQASRLPRAARRRTVRTSSCEYRGNSLDQVRYDVKPFPARMFGSARLPGWMRSISPGSIETCRRRARSRGEEPEQPGRL